MDKLLKEQNKVEGVDNMDASQMDSTVGAVLSFLKSQGINVDAVKGAIPNAEELMSKAETDNAKTSQGIMGKLGGLLAGASPAVAGNTTASAEPSSSTKAVDSMPAMLKCLTSAGISPEQLESALPLVAGTLKSKCGVDAYSALGMEAPSSGAATSSSGGGILGGLRGFLSDIKSETTGKE